MLTKVGFGFPSQWNGLGLDTFYCRNKIEENFVKRFTRQML